MQAASHGARAAQANASQCISHLRPETRVVLLTGNGTPVIEAEARRRGADAFLHKPLPLPQLEAFVDSLCRVAS